MLAVLVIVGLVVLNAAGDGEWVFVRLVTVMLSASFGQQLFIRRQARRRRAALLGLYVPVDLVMDAGASQSRREVGPWGSPASPKRRSDGTRWPEPA
jgi:hypothetical protein